MKNTPIVIRIYETLNGECPYVNWESEIKDKMTLARIRTRMERAKQGNFGDVKSLGEGVNELRLPFGSGYRIYFGLIGNEIVLLLCGGDKGTQIRDISKAKEYWADYKRR